MGGSPDDERDADVVVVGAGPAGCTLAYLLARSGVDTLLLERHADLDREFRGYLFQPRVLRLFDEMDVLDAVLALDHEEVRRPSVSVYGRTHEVFDYSSFPAPYDFALLMEQPPLLELLVGRASASGAVEYRPRTPVRDLLVEGGRVVGVRALDRDAGAERDLRARLVVGADGRYSTVRSAAGIDPDLLDSDVEIVWFKLPAAGAAADARARVGADGVLLHFGLGGDELQAGWFVEKGSYPDLRAEGIEAFRRRVARLDPALAPRLAEFGGFEDCSLLRIEPGMSDEWVRDGLVLVGDAAHVASPIGAQGNSLAIADAVVAHSTIVDALGTVASGPLPAASLRRFADERRPAVERVLRAQRRGERALSALVHTRGRLPPAVEAPVLRGLLALLVRTPFARRTRDLFAWGGAPVAVDRAAFVD